MYVHGFIYWRRKGKVVRLSRSHGHSLNKPRLRRQRPPATAYAAHARLRCVRPPTLRATAYDATTAYSTRRRTAFFAAFIAVVVARAPLRSALNSL